MGGAPATHGLDQPTMESELRALAWATLLTPAFAVYARFASRRLRPGLPRLAALFPTFPVFVYLPCMFNSLHLRLFSTFFHTWLAINKLVLLALDLGPLHPSLPLLPFVLCAGLPIKVRLGQNPTKHSTSSPPPPPVADFFRPCARSVLLLSCLAAVYPYTGWLPLYALHFLYCIQIFLTLDLVLSSAALVSAALLGASLERQFSAPLAVASLSDFWGRQWNLMAVDLLRASAYEPVRARWGRDAGVLAAFLMSGLLHELLYWYMTLQWPNGEMLRFFILHGVFQIAERWARAAGLWRPPKAAAYLLVSGFMVVTISEMFFGPFVRAGTDVRLTEEASAMMELVWSTVKHLLRPSGMVSS
ncbi:probable long-chain-alcohol O-fatty-acyltransferase 5 [Phragmites australis]|uniref:probable long-chain-alcohol O-fatty-acyltransferase 5 n=1 Tax=Phragmites australis TaxID=29695 RepID=UPI002D779420|nr:probable long-chain-alcohol O-fatty-acyltransferase 5 [Phragmites australis]